MSRKKAVRFFAATLMASSLVSCQKDLNENDGSQVINTTEFSYSTTQSANLVLTAPTYLRHATFEIYTDNPEKGGKLIAKARLDESGKFASNYVLPTSLESVFIRSSYVGLPDEIVVPISNGQGFYDYSTQSGKTQQRSGSAPWAQGANSRTYHYAGTYNNQGVPSYLTTPDVIDATMLADVNASLPERRPVPQHNPHYIVDNADTKLEFNSSADVWVTFIHEGAGYRNTFGYYTYNLNNPPQTPSDIDDIHIIFPNASAAGSGGGLTAGDKVYLGNFPANTGIGWVIIQNAWSGGSVNTGKTHYYATTALNPESTHDKRKHTVQLVDFSRDIIFVGMEDLNRDGNSDDDFNDAVFYVTAQPFTAVDTEDIPPTTTTGDDKDGDGVPDDRDDYPDDPDKAFDNFTPFEGGFTSVAFEDQWPNAGDYDFNDAVIDANYNHITNADNQIVEMEYKLVLRHMGASFHNGYGIEWPFAPSQIESIEGYNLTDGVVSLSANGTEANQSKAVMIAFDDGFDNLNKMLTIRVKLDQPYSYSILNLQGLNPFLISNATRGREIHLPNHTPTDLINTSYFGTADDASRPNDGVYFRKANGEPWCINISHDYAPPVERVNIKLAYLMFSDWVSSNGDNHKDWYEDKPGYRNPANVQ